MVHHSHWPIVSLLTTVLKIYTKLIPCIATQQPPHQFWPKTECQCGGKGFVPAHQYKNTTITLINPSPDWGNTVSNHDSTHTNAYTTDGGTTWIVDLISMNESYCENNDKCGCPSVAIKDGDTTAVEQCQGYPQFSEPASQPNQPNPTTVFTASYGATAPIFSTVKASGSTFITSIAASTTASSTSTGTASTSTTSSANAANSGDSWYHGAGGNPNHYDNPTEFDCTTAFGIEASMVKPQQALVHYIPVRQQTSAWAKKAGKDSFVSHSGTRSLYRLAKSAAAEQPIADSICDRSSAPPRLHLSRYAPNSVPS